MTSPADELSPEVVGVLLALRRGPVQVEADLERRLIAAGLVERFHRAVRLTSEGAELADRLWGDRNRPPG